MAAVGRHHRRGATAVRPRHLFFGFLCRGYDLVVDIVDVDLNVYLLDVDLAVLLCDGPRPA